MRTPGAAANRGNCSQACRLPYTVNDTAGHIMAHDKHVRSLTDNDQSANLRALIDAGIGSSKIEGRYKGPLQGHGRCQEHHRPLPPAA